MLRKGDIEDLLKATGKDVKKMSWGEKIKLYIAPYWLYIFSWLIFYFMFYLMFFF